jgi:hypothetical protein
MSISDGQSVNAAVTNAAFVSKTVDSSMSGKLDVTNTSDATGITDGAIHTDGGMGVEKSLHVGTTANVTGNINAGANVVVTGDVSAVNGTFTGDVDAVNSTLSGDLTAVNVNGTTVTTTNLFSGTSSLGTATANSLGVDTITTTGNVVVGGDLTVSGTTTTLNTATLEVTDANIVVNNGGSDATAEGAGLTIERTGTAGSLVYEDALASKFKIGASGSESEVVSVSTSQTLTNKTIDSDNNTITNIVNADIKAAAAIALDKLAATTASRALVSDASGFVSASSVTDTELGYVSGVTSAIQTQLGNKAETSDTVSLTTTQTITGYKRLDNEISLLEQSAAPGSPIAGYNSIYPKDDGVWYSLTSGGVETPLGSGGGGGGLGINFIDQSTFDYGIGDWVAFADAATSAPTGDGSGGTPNVTLNRVKPGIQGSSLRLTKDAANRQGEGFSFTYNVGPGFRTSAMQVRFYYKIYAGSYTSDALQVWIYDIANASWIQPTSYKIQNHSADSELVIAEFQNAYQTGINAGKYRVVFYIAGSDTNAWEMLFDYISVGPPISHVGSAITDWVSYTPTVTNLTIGNGTQVAMWKKVGDTVKIKYSLRVGSTTSFTASAPAIPFPSGLSIDTAKYLANDFGGPSSGWAIDVSTGTRYVLVTRLNGSSFSIQSDGVNSEVVNTVPFNWATGDYLDVSFEAPISGWSSSQIMSSDASTRVVAGSYSRSSGNLTINTTDTDITWANVIRETHSMMNTTTGVLTFLVPGEYKINMNLRIDSGGSAATQYTLRTSSTGSGLIPNGLYLLASTDIAASKAYNYYPNLQFQARAGDTLKFIATSATNSSTLIGDQSFLSVEMLQGPAQIAASESVSASYSTNTAQSISTGSPTIVNFEDLDYDSHGSVTTGASWKFTAPISGEYEVIGAIMYDDAALTVDDKFSLSVYKNGSEHRNLEYKEITATVTQYARIKGSIKVKLLAGDYIDLRTFQNSGSSKTLIAGTIYNYVYVTRVGQY